MEDSSAGRIPAPKVSEMPQSERMAMEKEATGLYLSGHPMDAYRSRLPARKVAAIGEIITSFSDADGRL